jgi:hypothetical protein
VEDLGLGSSMDRPRRLFVEGERGEPPVGSEGIAVAVEGKENVEMFGGAGLIAVCLRSEKSNDLCRGMSG